MEQVKKGDLMMRSVAGLLIIFILAWIAIPGECSQPGEEDNGIHLWSYPPEQTENETTGYYAVNNSLCHTYLTAYIDLYSSTNNTRYEIWADSVRIEQGEYQGHIRHKIEFEKDKITSVVIWNGIHYEIYDIQPFSTVGEGTRPEVEETKKGGYGWTEVFIPAVIGGSISGTIAYFYNRRRIDYAEEEL